MNIQVSSLIEIKIEETVFKLSREDAYTLFNTLKSQLNECTVPINAPTIAPNYPWYVPNYPAPMWYSSNNISSNNISAAN